MNKYQTFFDGQDISHRCVKCGDEDVVHKCIVKLQFAPFWATYLALGGGILSRFYKSRLETGTLRLGFCRKHKGLDGLTQDIAVVLSLVIGGGLIGYGMHTKNVMLQFAGCASIIGFYFFAKSGNLVKVVNISNGRITIKTKIAGV